MSKKELERKLAAAHQKYTELHAKHNQLKEMKMEEFLEFLKKHGLVHLHDIREGKHMILRPMLAEKAEKMDSLFKRVHSDTINIYFAEGYVLQFEKGKRD